VLAPITQGDWIAEGGIVKAVYPDTKSFYHTILSCPSRLVRLEQQMANAKLVAAAPDMLEAIQTLLNNLSPATLTHDNTLKEAILKAEFAIKKALEKEKANGR